MAAHTATPAPTTAPQVVIAVIRHAAVIEKLLVVIAVVVV